MPKTPRPGAERPLDVQLAEFRRRRLLAMPLAGTIVWTILIATGALLSPKGQVLSIYIGTGLIAYLGIGISKLTGEDFLDRSRPANRFDSLFFHGMGQALLAYAIALPFALVDHTSLPMTVGILAGMMWVPMSWILGHPVGIAHAVGRTVALVAVWYALPEHRFVACPIVVVLSYLLTIPVLEARWRKSARQPASLPAC